MYCIPMWTDRRSVWAFQVPLQVPSHCLTVNFLLVLCCAFFVYVFIVLCCVSCSGNRHDAYMLGASNLSNVIGNWVNPVNGKHYFLYADKGYPIRDWLWVPFRNPASADEQAFNATMSQHRIAVEWGFGGVITTWAYLNYSAQQKILLHPCAMWYRVAVLLSDIRTCMRGSNNISAHFGVDPPTVEDTC